jgi:protein-L-isoaspartate(D-aspartate) O-methyltransferase
MMLDFQQARSRMVDVYLARRGIRDPKVLDAFRSVPREAFVPDELAEFAYEDTPLPIGESQTISQPYIVALTAQALRLQGGERVLEVGAGSGYAAAILSHLVKDVYTIERIEALAESAKKRLAGLGFTHVQVTCGDGSLGWPVHAPYDAIAVAAGGPKVPPALLSQLAIGGRLVIPVGPDDASQVLMRITRESDAEYREEPLTDVRFVRLIGEQGWATAPLAFYGPGSKGSHYFYASLPKQFDEYLWFDETSAEHPLEEAPRPSNELPDTYPFGL